MDTVKAVAEFLRTSHLGYQIYEHGAPDNAPCPFVVVAEQGTGYSEEALSGSHSPSEGRLVVTTTAGTREGSSSLSWALRELLSPKSSFNPIAGGVSVKWEALRGTDIDRDALVPGTKLFPAYTIHTYRFMRAA